MLHIPWVNYSIDLFVQLHSNNLLLSWHFKKKQKKKTDRQIIQLPSVLHATELVLINRANLLIYCVPVSGESGCDDADEGNGHSQCKGFHTRYKG